MFLIIKCSRLIENVEIEKLKEEEPKFKDQSTSTSLSQLRMSLMIEYNQIGSLTSLAKFLPQDHPFLKRSRSNSIRRGSYSMGTCQPARSSASKVDVLKSAIEVNNSKYSYPYLKHSSGYLNTSVNIGNSGKVSNLFIHVILSN